MNAPDLPDLDALLELLAGLPETKPDPLEGLDVDALLEGLQWDAAVPDIPNMDELLADQAALLARVCKDFDGRSDARA